MFGSSLPPVVGRSAGVLFMLFVFASYSGIQHVLTIINKVSGVLYEAGNTHPS